MEMPAIMPTWRTKLGFWVILAMLATAFPEVVAGSSPWPFFTPWGVLVTTPLYGLHAIVLITIIVRLRALTWPALLFGGALFGLYEAYITKVLFDPHFAPELALKGFGVAWHHVALLVLWWHPLMAFIIPILVAETFMTSSRTVWTALPGRLRRWTGRGRRAMVLAGTLGLAAGLFTALAPPTVLDAFAVSAVNTGLILGLMLVWSRRTGRCHTLHALLPGTKGLVVMLGMLVVLYALTGALLLPDRLPSMEGHLSILACYGLFIALLWRCRGTSRPPLEEGPAIAPRPPYRHMAVFCGVYVLATPLTKLAFGQGLVGLFLVNWLAADVIGLALYVQAIRHALWRQCGRSEIKVPTPSRIPT